MLTLAQIKAGTTSNIAGKNVNDPEFVAYVNDAVRQLSELGDWYSTVKVMHGCAYDNNITWPSQVATVLAMNDCWSQLELVNHWYQFSDERWIGSKIERAYQGIGVVTYGNKSCVFRQMPSANCYMQFTITNPADVGKVVSVYGRDENGTYSVMPLVLAAGAGVKSSLLTEVSAITKDTTLGEVKAYWNIPGGTQFIPAGVYRPNDLSPEFLVTNLGNTGCAKSVKISALVKLNFEPMSNDSDICEIDNADAIKSMVQSIRKREAGDDSEADKFERTAIRRLNNQIRNRFPENEVEIAIKSFGTSIPSHYGVNRIV